VASAPDEQAVRDVLHRLVRVLDRDALFGHVLDLCASDRLAQRQRTIVFVRISILLSDIVEVA